MAGTSDIAMNTDLQSNNILILQYNMEITKQLLRSSNEQQIGSTILRTVALEVGYIVYLREQNVIQARIIEYNTITTLYSQVWR